MNRNSLLTTHSGRRLLSLARARRTKNRSPNQQARHHPPKTRPHPREPRAPMRHGMDDGAPIKRWAAEESRPRPPAPRPARAEHAEPFQSSREHQQRRLLRCILPQLPRLRNAPRAGSRRRPDPGILPAPLDCSAGLLGWPIGRRRGISWRHCGPSSRALRIGRSCAVATAWPRYADARRRCNAPRARVSGARPTRPSPSGSRLGVASAMGSADRRSALLSHAIRTRPRAAG